MRTGVELAVLDHNLNMERNQVFIYHIWPTSFLAFLPLNIRSTPFISDVELKSPGKPKFNFEYSYTVFSCFNIQAKYKKKSREGDHKPRFKISWHRYSKRFVAKKVMVAKKYDFLRNIALESYYRAIDSEKCQKQKRKRKHVTPRERPERDETIEKTLKCSRMHSF